MLPRRSYKGKCYIDINTKLLEGIKHTEQLTGVLLPLHGAAVNRSIGILEGDLISSIREIIGSELPIVVTLDLRAHVTRQIRENS